MAAITPSLSPKSAVVIHCTLGTHPLRFDAKKIWTLLLEGAGPNGTSREPTAEDSKALLLIMSSDTANLSADVLANDDPVRVARANGFGAMLREVRDRRNLAQMTLVAAANSVEALLHFPSRTGEGYFSNLETSRKIPNVSKILVICAALSALRAPLKASELCLLLGTAIPENHAGSEE